MIQIECCPPFQAKPSLWRGFDGWRFMWGWFAVSYFPYGLNQFVACVARAGIALEKKEPGYMSRKSADDPA